MTLPPIRRISATIMAAFGAVLLTGCFMVPGNFDAKLDLRSNGTFTYTYDGEIRLLGMTDLAQLGQRGSAVHKWDPDSQECWGEISVVAEGSAADAAAAAEDAIEDSDNVYGNRDCTEDELAERKEAFETGQEQARERREREAQQMQAVFGGVDPSDPNAGKQISERLERQHGWNSVEYLGEGLFKVDFSITSRIDHDFAFPTMEGMSAGQPFLYAFRRDENTIRIEAPGFTKGGSNGALGGGSMNWLMLASMDRRSNTPGSDDFTELLQNTNGTFTITTDGEILANNTDEGYRDNADGRTLEWQINSDNIDAAPPMALIKLAQ